MGGEVGIGSKLVGGEGERGSKCWSVDSGGGRGRGGNTSKSTIPLCTRHCLTISYCTGLLKGPDLTSSDDTRPDPAIPQHIVLVC